MKMNERKDWQKNPNTLNPAHDGRIQYWTDSGTMLTAMMSLARARELVQVGAAFAISDCAIGQCLN